MDFYHLHDKYYSDNALNNIIFPQNFLRVVSTFAFSTCIIREKVFPGKTICKPGRKSRWKINYVICFNDRLEKKL